MPDGREQDDVWGDPGGEDHLRVNGVRPWRCLPPDGMESMDAAPAVAASATTPAPSACRRAGSGDGKRNVAPRAPSRPRAGQAMQTQAQREPSCRPAQAGQRAELSPARPSSPARPTSDGTGGASGARSCARPMMSFTGNWNAGPQSLCRHLSSACVLVNALSTLHPRASQQRPAVVENRVRTVAALDRERRASRASMSVECLFRRRSDSPQRHRGRPHNPFSVPPGLRPDTAYLLRVETRQACAPNENRTRPVQRHVERM
ncbi:hypothetical protein PCL_08976 [Purpureocillium lilacinum]|uniref:Uncharacterized protein n=1 Tax=Purpureocillium lilacinum TaxID=33203 RepID=A0A2U3EGY2_PURLI|nr:hypothetical protein PCL_08976 [Purpureocillium lilacinum]